MLWWLPTALAFDQEVVTLVWAPYDNDLAFALDDILDAAIGSAPATVQSDGPGPHGMKRTVYTHDSILGIGVDDDDSASIEAFRDFLAWAGEHYEAERYVVAILDHGGRVGELARDDAPAGWLDTAEVGQALRDFQAAEPGRIGLVVLQVCTKATLEAAYDLRGAADELLASATAVAAPNPWFGPYDAGPLAPQVVARMPRDKWVQWTCLVPAAASELPARLPPALTVDTDALAPRVWTYAGDAFVDLDALQLDAAVRSWIDGELVCGSWQSPAPDPRLTEGYPEGGARLGLWLPDDSLPVDLPALWQALAPAQSR